MTDSTPPYPQSAQFYCPHLGLTTDPTVMLSVATPKHSCFVQHQPQTVDMAHQGRYCLSSQHPQCPFYRTFVRSVPNGVIEQPALESGQVAPSHLHAAPALPFKLALQATAITVVFALLFALFTLLAGWSSFEISAGKAPATALPEVTSAAAVVVPTPLVTATGIPTVATSSQVSPTMTATGVANNPNPIDTPTPEPGEAVFSLSPAHDVVGWWSSENSRRSYLNDSFLYAGFSQGETYASVLRLDLSNVPRGATIHQAQLRLTGLRQDRFNPSVKANWLIELLPETSLSQLGGADFLTIYSAPSSITLGPLEASELGQNKVNVRELDTQARHWLEQQLLAGARAIFVRLKAATANQETLFAWDSGFGPVTAGKGPVLLLSVGPAPPTPPPLPTKPFIVATPTSIPTNVLTVVALAETATSVAATIGTYTPVPFDIWTPTPFPENLATVQAVARAKDLPPVLVDTPTPASAAVATEDALYATAVAKTTGTFTPVPSAYVTPILVLPSPPAENQGTEVARILEATALAQNGAETATPLPYNAVMAQYVLATPTPENVATVTAQQLIASVYGAPTPLPWGVVVITPTPVVGSPTATPLPILLSVTDFTPTPTAVAAVVIPDVLPEFVHNKILFKTTRYGPEQIYAYDPGSGQLYQVTEPWVYPLAQKQLALAPDGKQVAMVAADANRVLQIYIHSAEYATTRQITAFSAPSPDAISGPISYDPAWSPAGDLITFVSTNSGNDEIYTVNLDGSVLTQLTANHFEWDKHPTWSSDGRQIVFFSNRETGRRLLWIMDVDGANQRNLSNSLPPPSNDQFEDWEPIWVR